MTVAEAIAMLQNFSANALFCLHRGDGLGTMDPVETIRIMPIDAHGPAYSDEDEGAIPVMVVELMRRIILERGSFEGWKCSPRRRISFADSGHKPFRRLRRLPLAFCP
jgi:hypothetical protein